MYNENQSIDTNARLQDVISISNSSNERNNSSNENQVNSVIVQTTINTLCTIDQEYDNGMDTYGQVASLPVETTNLNNSIHMQNHSITQEENVCCQKTKLICRKPWCRKKICGIHDDYDRHVRLCKKSHMKKSTVCSQCGKQFSKVSNLNRHIATVHSVLRKYVCKNCKKSYSDVDKLDNHLQRCTHSLINKEQSLIMLEENTIEDENMHDVITSESQSENIITEDLNLGSLTDNGLNNQNGLSELPSNTCSDDYDKPLENRIINRNNCEDLFIFSLKASDEYDIPFSSQDEMKNISGQNLRMFKERKTKSTICTHCNKQFSRVSNLNRHIRIVHKRKKYCCRECSKSYASQEKLHEHLISMHSPNSNIDETNNISKEENDLNHAENSFRDKCPINEEIIVEVTNKKKKDVTTMLTQLDETSHNLAANTVEENEVFIIDDMIQQDYVSKKLLKDNQEYDQCLDEIGKGSTKECLGEDEFGLKSYACILKEDHNSDCEEESKKRDKHEDDICSDTVMTVTPSVTTSFLNWGSQDTPRTKSVECAYCLKIFSKQSNLNRHIATVHDIKYTCENCSKSFFQAEKLENHIIFSSCKPNNSSYKLLKADTALPSMVIEEIFHQEKTGLVSPI